MYTTAIAPNSLYDVLPYSLPVLHTGKNWYVDFYCFDSVKGALRRKKYCLNKIKKNTDRKARAAEIITSVTARLRSGWNVWVKTESTREHTPFNECLELYKAYLSRSEKK